MPQIKTYRDLEAWQVAMDLVEECYAATKDFPVDERYGLTSQLRRAATSIPTNVAEGACRRTTPTYLNHVSIAVGSHGELETCIEIGFRLSYLSLTKKTAMLKTAGSVGRLLNGLLRSLEIKLEQARRS